MSRQQMVQDCDQAIQEVLPDLPRPEQKALAGLVTGVAVTQRATVSEASAGVPGAAQDRSKQRRMQRLLANPRLAVTQAQRHLIRHVLRRRRGPIRLLLDATTTGARGQQPGTQTLCLAVDWQGRALPLVWRTWPARARGQNWLQTIREMFALVQAAVPARTPVVVLADRGLAGARLARAVVAQGWHFVLRVTHSTRLRYPNGRVTTLGALVPKPHSRRELTGVRVWAPRHKAGRGAGGWVSEWDQALRVQVVARGSPTDPWLLVTSLPATDARTADYRRRMWIEELFRDLKSFGWNWQDSRLTQPDRVDRLLLVLTLATLWLLALAQYVVETDQLHWLEERSRRCYSLFQVGLRWLRRCLTNDLPVLCLLDVSTPSAPLVKLS